LLLILVIDFCGRAAVRFDRLYLVTNDNVLVLSRSIVESTLTITDLARFRITNIMGLVLPVTIAIAILVIAPHTHLQKPLNNKFRVN
jgi:hypothetical protein